MALKFDKIACAYFFISCILDRFTKYCVITELWPSQTINQFFNVYLTHNHGIAWGLGSSLHTPEFCWLTLIITGVLAYFTWYMKSVAHHTGMFRACMFVLAGGVSNLFDRLWYGSVIDFIQLHAGDWYFPVFNIADVSITIGAIFLIYFALLDE